MFIQAAGNRIDRAPDHHLHGRPEHRFGLPENRRHSTPADVVEMFVAYAEIVGQLVEHRATDLIAELGLR